MTDALRAPGGRTARSVDPASVDPLDWGAIAAGPVSLIFSFFGYYTYAAHGVLARVCHRPGIDVFGRARQICSGTGGGAWHGFFGWFGALLAAVGAALVAVAVFAPRWRPAVSARLLALVAYTLAVVCTVIALFDVPDYRVNGMPMGGPAYDHYVDEGHGFAYYVALVLIITGLVLTFVGFVQTGGPLGVAARDGAAGPPPAVAAPAVAVPPVAVPPPPPVASFPPAGSSGPAAARPRPQPTPRDGPPA